MAKLAPAGGLLLSLAVLGCGASAAPGTGAREAAQSYFEALCQRDWERAFSSLEARSRARLSKTEFARLAQEYNRQLGFEPQGVKLRACNERGLDAVAHVLVTGRTGSKDRRFKDAVVLRQDAGRWAVVLPASFGRPRTRSSARR